MRKKTEIHKLKTYDLLHFVHRFFICVACSECGIAEEGYRRFLRIKSKWHFPFEQSNAEKSFMGTKLNLHPYKILNCILA